MHAEWAEYQNENGKYSISNRASDNIAKEYIFNEALINTIKILRKNGKQVVIIGPIPKAPNGVQLGYLFHKFKNTKLPDEYEYGTYLKQNKAFNNLLSNIRRENNIQVIYPSEYLCDYRKCNYMINNRLLYLDDNHLKYPDSVALSPYIRKNIHIK
jgi:hypothetical protein